MATMAIDQHGNTEHDLGAHPRTALLRRLGRTHASRMFVDDRTGTAHHIGWVIAGRWFTVYHVERMDRAGLSASR